MTVLQSILAPRETVNDETVYVTAVHVKEGARVAREALLVDVETSKAVFSIHAEVEGYARLRCAPGDEVVIGEVLLEILDSLPGEDAQPRTEKPGAADNSVAAPDVAPVISQRAAELLAAHQIPESRFARQDFVLARDVEALLRGGAPQEPRHDVPAPSAKGRAPQIEVERVEIEPLSRTKKTEIRYLADVQSSGLVSTVAASFAAEGAYAAMAACNGLFAGSLLPLLCYEVSRLLRKYRALNACFLEDSVAFYKEVNIGVAVDMEKGLKVLTLYRADRENLQETDSKLFALVDRYCEDSLETADTSHSTFTITDLSAFGVDFFLPLVNARQSAILGVSAQDKNSGRVTLTLSFDHRVTDGKTAGLFLKELGERLESYATDSARLLAARCSVCLKTLEEDAGLDGVGLVQRINHLGVIDHICIVCLRGGA